VAASHWVKPSIQIDWFIGKRLIPLIRVMIYGGVYPIASFVNAERFSNLSNGVFEITLYRDFSNFLTDV